MTADKPKSSESLKIYQTESSSQFPDYYSDENIQLSPAFPLIPRNVTDDKENLDSNSLNKSKSVVPVSSDTKDVKILKPSKTVSNLTKASKLLIRSKQPRYSTEYTDQFNLSTISGLDDEKTINTSKVWKESVESLLATNEISQMLGGKSTLKRNADVTVNTQIDNTNNPVFISESRSQYSWPEQVSTNKNAGNTKVSTLSTGRKYDKQVACKFNQLSASKSNNTEKQVVSDMFSSTKMKSASETATTTMSTDSLNDSHNTSTQNPVKVTSNRETDISNTNTSKMMKMSTMPPASIPEAAGKSSSLHIRKLPSEILKRQRPMSAPTTRRTQQVIHLQHLLNNSDLFLLFQCS